MIYHFPYYHLKTGNINHGDTEDHPRAQFEHLCDYQESTTGAVIIRKNSAGIHIIFIPSATCIQDLQLNEEYKEEVVKFVITNSYEDPTYGTIGIIADGRVEYEGHPAGSGYSYSLRRYYAHEPGHLVGIPPQVSTINDYLVYEVPNSIGIDDPWELYKIDSKFRAYILVKDDNLVVGHPGKRVVEDEGVLEEHDNIFRKDIYSFELIEGIEHYRFPAGYALGEDVNNTLPPQYVGIPGYGSSSGSKVDANGSPFAIDIPTQNENATLKFMKLNQNEFIPSMKNNSIILDGSYIFELTYTGEIEKGITIFSNFYLPKCITNSKKESILSTTIDEKELNVYLVPKGIDDSFTEAGEKNTYDIEQQYFFALEYDNTVILYELTLNTNSGYNISIIFLPTTVEIEINNIRITSKSIMGVEDIFNIEFFETTLKLFNKFSCLLKNIQILAYTGEVIEPLDYFVDYKMSDFYNIRTCDPTCMGALKIYSTELKQDIYVPKQKIDAKVDVTQFCPFVEYGLDPYRNLSNAAECSRTELLPVNTNYPVEFNEDMIQAPHYKVGMNLNHEPFSATAIVNESQCRMLYDVFETGRPISRFSHYDLNMIFTTDFSGKAHTLYMDSSGANGLSRCTIFKEVMEDSDLFTVGETGFDDILDEGVIEHELNSTDILAQSFDLGNKLMYPAQQYAKDMNTYVISFAPNKMSGYALIQKAKNITIITQALRRPFYVYTNGVSETAVILQLQNENNFREELLNFNAIGTNIKVDLLDTFGDGKTLVNEMDAMFYVARPAKVGNIEHNLDMMGCMIQVYDTRGKAMKPSEAVLIDKNNLKICFDRPMAGTIGLRKVANPYGKDSAINDIIPHDRLNENGEVVQVSGYFLIGSLNGSDNINGDYGSNFNGSTDNSEKIMQSKNPIRIDVVQYYETEQEYTFVGRVPAYGADDLEIREIGLHTYDGRLCFYSIGNVIYVIRDFEFTIHYVIKKQDYKQIR